MKSNRYPFALLAMAAASAVAGSDTSGTNTGAAAAPAPAAGQVPDSNAAGAEKAKRAPKNPDNILDIINGRLPVVLVYAIRFKEVGQPTAAVAKKYGTSVGKVFDIVKGRNFGYVTEAYKPSAEEVAAAKNWCEVLKTAKGKSLKEAGGDPEGIMTLVNGLGVATAEEVAARGWVTRVVGQKADAGTAPVAGAGTAAPAAAAAAPAGEKAAGQGAKLF